MIKTVAAVVTATPEIHWGNVGSFVGGIATAALAVVAMITGTAALQDWRLKQREQRALAEEQRNEIRLNRQRVLQGWSLGGVSTYGVKLATDADELRRAAEELITGGPSEYVLLRVSEGGSNVNRAHNLRSLIDTDGYVSRAPSAAELEALEVGRERLLSTGEASPTA